MRLKSIEWRPSQTKQYFLTKNIKDNASWCYNIIYSANTICLLCGPSWIWLRSRSQSQTHIHTKEPLGPAHKAIGPEGPTRLKSIGWRPSQTKQHFLTKNNKDNTFGATVLSTMLTLHVYTVVHSANTLCIQYLHNVFHWIWL